jgi:Tol biopolymer transport system component
MKPRTSVAVAVVTAAILTAALAAPTSATSSTRQHHDPGRGHIVFGAETTSGTQLWTMRPDGTHLRQVTHVDGDAVNPDWSPDGRQLTFEWDTEDAGMVAVMHADGSDLRTLPQTGCEFEGQPVFSADQRRIIYERYDCDVDDSLFSQRAKGGDEQRLTDAFPDGHTDPNVSPNGRYLSFIRYDGGVEFQQALTVAHADGTGQRDLLPPSWDIAIKHAWSPDNCHLVFTRDANPDPVTGILSANLGIVSLGGHVRMLTHFSGGTFSAFAGSYSPDGRWIVYRLQDNDTGESALHVIRTDGSNDHEIFAQAGVRARFIDWG